MRKLGLRRDIGCSIRFTCALCLSSAFCVFPSGIFSSSACFANEPSSSASDSVAQQRSSVVTPNLPAEIAELLNKKNYRQAEVALEKLYVSTKNPTLLFELGTVAAVLGRQVAAADLYRRYLDSVEEQALLAARNPAESFLKSFDAPNSEISVNGPVGGFLYVDDHPVGTLPLPNSILVGPEPHVFRIISGSLRSNSESLSIPTGRRGSITLTVRGKSLSTLLSLSQGTLLRVDSDDVSSALVDSIYRTVAKSIETHYAVLIDRPRQDAVLKQQPGLVRCLKTGDCQEPLVNAGELSFVLELTIKTELDHTQLSMRVFDVLTASYGSVRTEDCARDDVPQRAAALASVLIAEVMSRDRGTLSVVTNPAGVKVAVDDIGVGLSPYRRDSFVGSRRLSLSAPGYSNHTATVLVESGQETSLNVTLTKLPGREFAGRPLWRAGLGGGLLAAGLLVAGFGVAALSVDGRCTGDLRADDGFCNYFDTSRLGLALTIPGAAAATIGGLLFAWPPRREQPSPRPTS